MAQINMAGIVNKMQVPETSASLKPAATKEDKTLHLFISRIPNSTFVFPDGTIAVFKAGQYATDVEAKIQWLNHEISEGHPFIYVDPEKVTVLQSDLDPEQALRKRIIAEYLAEQQAIAKGDKDMGTSEQGKLNVAGSNAVKELTAS